MLILKYRGDIVIQQNIIVYNFILQLSLHLKTFTKARNTGGT